MSVIHCENCNRYIDTDFDDGQEHDDGDCSDNYLNEDTLRDK